MPREIISLQAGQAGNQSEFCLDRVARPKRQDGSPCEVKMSSLHGVFPGVWVERLMVDFTDTSSSSCFPSLDTALIYRRYINVTSPVYFPNQLAPRQVWPSLS